MATIPYANIKLLQPWPIDGQDVVTNPLLVIAGSAAGRAPDRMQVAVLDGSTWTFLSPVGIPVTHEKADAKHATYKASRALDWPVGVNPWTPPADLDSGLEPSAALGNFTNAGTPSAVRDGDGATYGTATDVTSALSFEYVSSIGAYGAALSTIFHGFRVRYELKVGLDAKTFLGTGAPIIITMVQESFHRDGASYTLRYRTEAKWHLPYTSGDEVTEFYALLPMDARGHVDNITRLVLADTVNVPLTNTYKSTVQFSMAGQAAGAELKVYEFYPLVVNAGVAEAIIAQNVRAPASDPKRIVVSGIIAADAKHTITGWPGEGDVEVTVAQHNYVDGDTEIDIEDRGPVPLQDVDALHGARVQQLDANARIRRANYNLLMGERQ